MRFALPGLLKTLESSGSLSVGSGLSGPPSAVTGSSRLSLLWSSTLLCLGLRFLSVIVVVRTDSLTQGCCLTLQDTVIL